MLHTQLGGVPAFSLSFYFFFPEEWEQELIYWAEDFCAAVPDGWWWHKLAVLGISRKLKLGRLSYTEEASKHTQEPKIGWKSRHMDWGGSEALDLDSRLNINCCECGVSPNQLQHRAECSEVKTKPVNIAPFLPATKARRSKTKTSSVTSCQYQNSGGGASGKMSFEAPEGRQQRSEGKEKTSRYEGSQCSLRGLAVSFNAESQT